MALFDTTWYCNAGDQSTTGYYAVAKWAANTAYAAGAVVRQNAAPAVGSERIFVCIVAGTSHLTTEPTWTTTRGAKTTDNASITWQECTGASAVNGDATNTPTWAASTAYTLGQIIKRVNGASYWICSTAGTTGGSEPAWANDTAGTTRTDNTATWTCLGVVGNWAAWANPHARLANATTSTWFASGNTVYVASAHAESQTTAITISPASTYPALGKILCVNAAGSMPPVAADLTTGASIATTAASVNLNINGTNAYFYGLTYKAGSGVSSGSNNMFLTVGVGRIIHDNCSFQLLNTTSNNTSTIGVATTSISSMLWNNCKVKFSTTSQQISPGNHLWRWQNTATILESGSSVPTSFFKLGGNNAISSFHIVLEALDLSQLSGSINSNNTNSNAGVIQIIDCKLHASLTVTALGNDGLTVQFIRSDSGATAYKSSRTQIGGTESTETTITRVGGATDPAGNAQSRKIVTTANASLYDPFNGQELAVWNPTVAGSVTVTIYGTINSASLPNNDELWAECEYLGTASFPLGNLLTSRKATVLTASGATGANANISTDTSTWNGGGSGAGWTPFKIVFQLDTTHNPQPQFAGYIMIRVKAAKVSTTYYIDPQITLS